MKHLALISTFVLSIFIAHTGYAQSEESRTKIQLTVNFGGKTIVTDVNSVSTSISRMTYDEALPTVTGKDTVKTKPSQYNPNAFYLSIDAKKISDEMLNVFAKKQNRFDGMITIVDTYGKNPTRTIKFKQGTLYSYSDQLSGSSYSDGYGSSIFSIGCKEVSINGIVFEQ